MDDFEASLRELLERDKIHAALRAYARGVDRQEWNLVRGAYHPDAYDDHGGYKGDLPGLMDWLQRRHANIEQSMHFLGNCTIDFKSPDVAIAETYCVAYQRYGEEARETIRLWLGDVELAPGMKVMAELSCRYVDRFERRNGTWRIAHRTVVMEEVKANINPDRLQAAWALSRRDRSDTLWKKLEG